MHEHGHSMIATSIHRPTSRSLLLPREHGAYGELGFPLLTAFLIGRATIAAIAFALASIAAFVAHESLLIVLRQRGQRAFDNERARAFRWLIVLSACVVAAATVGLVEAEPAVRAWCTVPAGLAGIAIALVLSRRERTLLGEMVVSSALVSASLPVAVSAGAPPSVAVTMAVVWMVNFGLSTIAIRGLIAASRTHSRPTLLRASRLVSLLLVTIAIVMTARRVSSPAVVAGITPAVVMSLLLAGVRPSPRRLRTVGWMLVGASTLTAGALTVLCR